MRAMYVAAVEVGTRRAVDFDDALETLGDYSPVVVTSPRGWVEVQIRFSATGLAHACTKAAALARAATGTEAIACRVMTLQEHEARRLEVEGADGSAEGRHAAPENKPWVLPRQASEAWERTNNVPGRHSA